MNIAKTAILYLSASKGTSTNQSFSRQASLTTFRTTTPYSQKYDGGAQFVDALSRATKSRRDIKSLVESGYGDKNISYRVINSLIKTVKDKKFTKMTKRTTDSGFCHHCQLESLTVKPSTKLISGKLWLCHSPFSSQKRSLFLVPGLISVQGLCPSPHCRLSPGLQMVAKAERQSATSPFHHIGPADFFLF